MSHDSGAEGRLVLQELETPAQLDELARIGEVRGGDAQVVEVAANITRMALDKKSINA
jgi:hypothetical protein